MMRKQIHDRNFEALKCQYCDSKLVDLETLQTHVAENHSKRQCVYTCQYCGQVCSFASDLEDHTLKTHGLESQILTYLKRLEQKYSVTDDSILAARAELNILSNEFSILKNAIKTPDQPTMNVNSPVVEEPAIIRRTQENQTSTETPN